MRLTKRFRPLGFALVPVITLPLLAPGQTLAAPFAALKHCVSAGTRGGSADLAGAWNDGGLLSTAVYLSNGRRFPGWTQWSVRDGGWIDSARWAAGDFNGDRRTDLVAIWNNGGQNTLTVSQSTGSSFMRRHWATNAGGWSDTTVWCAGQFN